MTAPLATEVARQLAALDAAGPLYAAQAVDLLLAAARQAGASDLHLQPTARGLAVRWRIDGVLQPVGECSRGEATDIVSRLKVLAGLLTYRTDVPQEGRIRPGGLEPRGAGASPTTAKAAAGGSAAGTPSIADEAVEMRVSTFPTLHGERAVVRLFAPERRLVYLADLELPTEVFQALSRLVQETSGALLLTGPAGSGKTTTAYACLREVVRAAGGRRSVVTLEDPIEMALPGVSQSQVQPAAGFTLASGLRSLLRQDPEVILVGEIRDAETVYGVFQAALTGHLVVSTLHAGSAAGALSRLIDMGIEPYLLTSSLRAVVQQRLLRRLCDCAAAVVERAAADPGVPAPACFLGLPVRQGRMTVGCPSCAQTGYRGRLPLAELLPPLVGELGRAVLARRDVRELARLAAAAGMKTLLAQACERIEAGQTDAAEARRVLGFGEGGEEG